MRGAGVRSRAGQSLLLAALVVSLGTLLTAQDGSPDPVPDQTAESAPDLTGQVLILNQERLFQQSRFGQASLARENEAAGALEAENSRILVDLIDEEQALTTQRATLPPAEFTQLAEAFDEKAERIRREQDAKLDALVEARNADRTEFLRAIGPILTQLLREKGAAAIVDASTVVLFSPTHDITDEATQRIDAVLSADAPPLVDPEPAPTP